MNIGGYYDTSVKKSDLIMSIYAVLEAKSMVDWRKIFSAIVRWFVGFVLLVSTIAKVYELVSYPVLDQSIFGTIGLGYIAIEFQLVLGLFLLGNLFQRATWAITVATFSLFTCITTYKVAMGSSSCGCFGRFEVNPLITFALDISILGLLVLTRPKRITTTNISKKLRSSTALRLLAVCCVVGLSSGILGYLLYSQGQTARGNLEYSNSGRFVILEPISWHGRQFPLLPYLTKAELLKKGLWVVLLHRPGCHLCEQALPRYLNLGSLSNAAANVPQVAMVSLSENKDQRMRALDERPVHCKLSAEREWFAQTPIALFMEDGKVLATAEGEDATNLQWLDLAFAQLRLLRRQGQLFHIEGTPLEGELEPKAGRQGKYALIEFWATWCGTCHQLRPKINELHRRFGNKGLEIIGVSTDQDLTTLKQFIKNSGFSGSMNWKQLWNPYVVDDIGISLLPTVLLLEKEGKIIFAGQYTSRLEDYISSFLGSGYSY